MALRYASATATTAIPAAAPLITTLLVVLATQQVKLAPLDGIGLVVIVLSVVVIFAVGMRREVRAWMPQRKAAAA
jgi:hypothetical protein